MAVPPRAMSPEKEQKHHDDGDDDFTFPTPPPQFLAAGATRAKNRHHLPCSTSPPPMWLHFSSCSPIRRSFSAADCPASPWRDRLPLSRCRSPALSDYVAVGEEEDEEEERMDSLWEDLNDDGDDLFLHATRRRSVGGGADAGTKEREGVVLGTSRSSRRRAPGLVTMMRALKKMFVAHKGKSRVHRDEQSTVASASASPTPSPSPCNKR